MKKEEENIKKKYCTGHLSNIQGKKDEMKDTFNFNTKPLKKFIDHSDACNIRIKKNTTKKKEEERSIAVEFYQIS